jgi:predicted RNase H-like nuclease (RuvC/YqgF family)
MEQSNNTQLPAEVVKQISAKAKEIANALPIKCDGDVIYKVGYEEGHAAGATAWAPWFVKHNVIESELVGVRAENVRLQSEIKKANESNFNLQESNDQWKVKYDELKKVLQEFVTRHEGGLLPDRFVYEKAIKILNDGTTTNNAGQD